MENSKSGCVRKVKYLTTKSHHLLLLNDSNTNANSNESPNAIANENAIASKKSSATNTSTSGKEQLAAATANKNKGKPRTEPEKVKVKVKVSSSGICKFEPHSVPKKSSAKHSNPPNPAKSRNAKIPETKAFKIVKKRSPDSLKATSKPKKQSKAAAIQEYVFYDSDEDITNGPAVSKAKIAELQRATLISKCSVTVHDNLNILTPKSLPSYFLNKNKDKGNPIDSTKEKSTTVTKPANLPKLVKEKPATKSPKEKPETQSPKSKPPPKASAAEVKSEIADDEPPPKKPRKLRKPTAEESLVEGFAFLAFKSYEDLTRAVATAEGTPCPHQVAKCVQLVKGKVSKGRANENDNKPEKSESKSEKRAKKTVKVAMSVVNVGIRPASSVSDKISRKLTAPAFTSTQKCTKTKKTRPPKSASVSSSMNGKGKETKSAPKSSDTKPKTKPSPKKNKTKGTSPESQQRAWPHSFKISDGCTDLFAPVRKDSSPNQLADNLHSPLEKARERERERERGDPAPAQNREVKSSGSPPSITAAVAPVAVSILETSSPPALSRSPSSSPPGISLKKKSVAVAVNTDVDNDDDSGHDSPSTTPRIRLNGPLSLTNQDRNGHGPGNSDDNRSPESPSPLPANNATVSPKAPPAVTPPPQPPARPMATLPPKKDKSRTPKQKAKALAKVTHHKLFTPYATTSITTRTSTPTTDSGSYISVLGHFSERRHELDCNSNSNSSSSSSSLPYPGGKEHCTDAATYINSITGHHPPPLSPLVIDKSIGPPPNILSTFNSKAPPLSRSGSSSSSSTKSTSTGFESIARLLDSSSTKSNKRSGSPVPKSSKAHRNSGGGHGCQGNVSSQSSPCRERDSYSSASSLSRGSSVTPLNGSGFSQQLPSNLSPLQDLSRAKATSWLSGAAGLSPAPRPTPPPASSASSSSTSQSTHSHSIYSGLGSGPSQPGMPPSTHHSHMYPPGMLPLHGSMMGHPPGQHSPFGPASNELVRRDLESRFLAERAAAGAGGPNSFIPRSGELHPHHLFHMQGPTGVVPPHSPLFSAPYYKDMPRMGLDSPFYRSSLGLPYPGINGILPPSSLSTPFTTPGQQPAFTAQAPGRWNAMHVRISWEVYHHQQKEAAQEKAAAEQGARNGSTTTTGSGTTTNSSTTSSSASGNTGRNSDSSVTVMPLGSLDPANRSNHSMPDLHRPGDMGGPGLPPLLPPSHQPPPFDPNSPLFMQSPPLLAPPLGRGFPPFGSLGPAFGGLGGIGPNILGRDIGSLGALPPSHDQWLRMQRAAHFPNWPMMSRDKADERDEKRNSENKGGNRDRDHPPRARSRSPHRSSRASAENGDTGSRSSSSNSTSAKSSAHKSRENSGDKDKSVSVPLLMLEREREERDKLSAAHQSLMNDKALPFIPSTYSSRMFNPASSMTGWDSFPGMTAAQRAAIAAEPYRQSLLQLSERERELAARVPIRPALPGNGNGPPFMTLPPLAIGPGGGPPPRSASALSLVSGSKGSGSIPLLNPSMSIGALSGHSFHGHHHSSPGPNGPPNNGGSPSSRTKEDSHSR